MDQRRFYNACMSLMNIDMHELVAAGIIAEGNYDRGGSSWKRFNDDPLVFMAKIDDVKRDALWRMLEERQRVHDPKPVMLAALKKAEEFMRGFEDDEMQEGINARLATLRAAIELSERD